MISVVGFFLLAVPLYVILRNRKAPIPVGA
jgi:hypothetical protein